MMMSYKNAQTAWGLTAPAAVNLGLNYDFLEYGVILKLQLLLARSENTHLLCIGQAGSGKSYELIRLLALLKMAEPMSEIYFADFKGEFEFLKGCPRYFAYKDVYTALDLVYKKLCDRLAGKDISESPVTFIFDEYVSAILSRQAEDKKAGAQIMSRIAEILLMGRACGHASVRFWCFTQRPDASVFSTGSRDQFGTIIALGNISKETKQMIFSEFSEDFEENKQFQRGEGRIIMNGGAKLFHIKVPQVRDMEKVKELCKKALS